MEEPLVITKRYVNAFIKGRRGKINKTPKLDQKGKIDRDYLMGIFSIIFNRHEKLVRENKRVCKKEFLNRGRNLTSQEMFEASSTYIAASIEHGQPLTFTNLALFMGMSRNDLLNEMQMGVLEENDLFISDYCSFIESYNEYAAHKKMNPAGPIFILKNFGWKDKFEIEASNTPGALDQKQREEAQKMIAGFKE